MIGSGAHQQRLIFENVPYEQWEYEHLEALERALEEERVSLPESFAVYDRLRFLQATKYKTKKTVEAIQNHLQWRAESLPPVLNDASAQLINSGFIYVHGRDRFFRPMLIINPRRLLQFKGRIGEEDVIRATVFLLEYMKNYMFLPAQVENWLLICDTAKLGMTELPKDIKDMIRKVNGTLSDNFRCRMCSMFILNTSFFATVLWTFAKTFLKEHTKRKIKVTGSSTHADLLQLVEPSQLEQRFGGLANNVEQNFWPPIVPSQHFGQDSRNLVTRNEYAQLIQEGTRVLTPSPYLQQEQKDKAVRRKGAPSHLTPILEVPEEPSSEDQRWASRNFRKRDSLRRDSDDALSALPEEVNTSDVRRMIDVMRYTKRVQRVTKNPVGLQ